MSASLTCSLADAGPAGIVQANAASSFSPLRRLINLGQEFVVGVYTPAAEGFDALIVGYYRGR
jgi:hypothetical protein